jgi:hypothetical protein
LLLNATGGTTNKAIVVDSGDTDLKALNVTGATTLTGTLTVSGDNATSLGGTLGVTGISTLTGALNANGGIAVGTDKFTVSTAGAVSIASTLGVTGALTAATINALSLTSAATGFSIAGGGTNSRTLTNNVNLTIGATTTNTGNVTIQSNSSTAASLTITGTASISGTNTGDQTTVTGSSGSLKSTATTGVMTITGPSTGTTRVKTVRDANDTILELGGTYTTTPVSGQWTFNNTTNKTATVYANTTQKIAGSLGVDGNQFITGNLYFPSDERLKDKHEIVSSSVLDSVLATDIWKFSYKAKPDQVEIGLMAQELERNFPELADQLVTSSETEEFKDQKSLKESKLIYVLWAALQEETNKRKELEEKINKIIEKLGE